MCTLKAFKPWQMRQIKNAPTDFWESNRKRNPRTEKIRYFSLEPETIKDPNYTKLYAKHS